MNNYYALIYLTEHLNSSLNRALFQFSISPHRNVWEGYFKNPDGADMRLIFSCNPGEIALFTAPWRSPKKSNVLHFFESLEGEIVDRIELAECDRLLTIRFVNGCRLLFQLFGGKANLFRLEGDLVTDAFKSPGEVTGTPPPEPRMPTSGRDQDPGFTSPRKWLLHYDQTFPRHLTESVIRHFQLEEAAPEEIRETVQTLQKAMLLSAEFRALKEGTLCLIPRKLLPLEDEKVFDGINEAVTHLYYKMSHERRFTSRIGSLRSAIDDERAKVRKTLSQFEGAEKAYDRADRYEKFGHLLMANAHRSIPPGSETLEVTDFYEANLPLKIPVKPELSVAGNAEIYYEKSAKTKKRSAANRRRESELRNKLPRLEQLSDSLARLTRLHELDPWLRDQQQELDELGLLRKSEQRRSLPYKRTFVDGFEVWIGKSARSNDELTNRAHKEDIWMHARGIPGSHVVIRMENSQEYPPKKTLLRVASHAAWHSSGRTSSLVPVMFTKRKYVTRPKGSPPGSVRVKRESVEMVRPEPLKS